MYKAIVFINLVYVILYTEKAISFIDVAAATKMKYTFNLMFT